MNKTYSEIPNDITYAALSQVETEKLKELEQAFNNQFQCKYYLMVMKSNTMKS